MRSNELEATESLPVPMTDVFEPENRSLFEFETPTEPGSNWIPLEEPKSVTEAIVPKTVRIDESRVGKADYDDVTECFIDDDDRRPLRQAVARPNRWVCKLQVAFEDPDTGDVTASMGSGLLIGNRFVLTAAHVLFDEVRDSDGNFEKALDASAVVVIPGLNGRRRRAARGRASDTMPFGWTHGTAFRTHRVFRTAMHASGAQSSDFDYAVIKLAEPIGSKRFPAIGRARLGFWGGPGHRKRTIMRVKSPKSLRRVRVNAVGYPQDKCADRPVGRVVTEPEYDACRVADLGSVPWYSFERIVSAGARHETFSTLRMEHDVAPGMSGGPVWLRYKSVRNLIGILHACDAIASKQSPFTGALATKITKAVKRDIQTWIS